MASAIEKELAMFNKHTGEHRWEAMRKVDIRTVDKSQLVDIRTIKIDEKLPPIDRWFSYLSQVKNPYCVRVGDMAVKLSFPDEH